jgi:cysteine desulfurase
LQGFITNHSKTKGITSQNLTISQALGKAPSTMPPLPARAYFDYAATAPLRMSAHTAMQARLGQFGNASSVHQEGQTARHVLDDARRTIGDAFGVHAASVVFTSGGTEANNLALRGVMQKAFNQRLLISAVEHDCVRNTGAVLNAETLPVDAQGIVQLNALEATLKQGGVALVSVLHANNETGVLQPITEITKLCHQHGALCHTDAVQTAGHLPLDFNTLGVDLLTLSAHKLGGPQGIGAMLVKPEVAMQAHITGGGQERNRRAGTENILAVAGFAAALEEAMHNLTNESATATHIRNILRKTLPAGWHELAPHAEKVPHILGLQTGAQKGEDVVMALDLFGIAASQGSACSSGRVQASHVLQAMGYSAADAACQLRLSWGWGSTTAQAIQVAEQLHTVAKQGRSA